jgi:transposase
LSSVSKARLICPCSIARASSFTSFTALKMPRSFIVDVVAKLDLQPIRARYAGRGSAAYQPEMMVALLLYGYATGVFSSRKLERATYDSVAFRYITAN